MTPPPRLGIYICHCGVNIAATVDVPAVVQFAARLAHVAVARDYTYMCSDPGQAQIQGDITALGLNRIVVASCSPRMHEPTFRAAAAGAGLNPYCVEMANIREQCAWVHLRGPAATLKAMELVAAAAARAARLNPLESRQVAVTPGAVIIGGGIAGLQAALDIADAGFQATLVERTADLGGRARALHQTFPAAQPASDLIAPLVARATHHPRLTVLTESEITAVDGCIGNFRVTVRGPAGPGPATRTVEAGAIIVATGFDIFDARRRPELGFGAYPEVITTLDFEQLAAHSPDLSRSAVGGPSSAVLSRAVGSPSSVVFIQCVGSRDRQVGNAYCSRVCCMVAARQAQLVRTRLPGARVTVLYMDVRAYGKGFEAAYDSARGSGVLYRRGQAAEIRRGPAGQGVVVRFEDTLLGEPVELPADLVVLAVGMQPRPATAALAGLLKLARSADGFLLEAHPKLRPVDTTVAGVFVAGCCQGPKDIADSLAQARAAAAAALILLLRGHAPVEAATAAVNEELCAGCGQCALVCAYGALALHPMRGVMTVNGILCQGCGACAAACPSESIDVRHYTLEQTLAQVEALV